MKLTVKSAETFSDRTSKGNVIVKQQVALDQGRDYPLVFDIVVGNAEGSNPYPAGEYDLDPRSFRLGRFGGLELDPYGIKLASARGGSVKAA